MGYILGLLMLVFLILIHEAGHAISAKAMGIKVKTFCVGLGRPIRRLSWKSPKSGTVYGIAPIPFGGMVEIKGMLEPNTEKVENKDSTLDAMLSETTEDEPLSSDSKDDNFYTKPYWKKVIVLASGSVANLFLGGVLIFTGIAFFTSTPTNRPYIERVVKGQPAEAGGMLPGDKVYGYVLPNGQTITTHYFSDIKDGVKKHATVWLIKRQNEIITIDLSNHITTPGNPIGVVAETRPLTITETVKTSWAVYLKSYEIIIQSYSMLITGNLPVSIGEAVSGPIGIIASTGSIINEGDLPIAPSTAAETLPNEVNQKDSIRMFLLIWGLISINLGLVNLLPILPFDGGKIIEEAIPRKIKNTQRLQGVLRYTSTLVFFIMMGLMVIITINDIFKLTII